MSIPLRTPGTIPVPAVAWGGLLLAARPGPAAAGHATLAAAVPVVMLLLAAAALAVAAALRVFRPASILGPRRLGRDEPLSVLFGVIGLGLLAWLLVPTAYATLRPRPPAPVAATQPAVTTEAATEPTTNPVPSALPDATNTAPNARALFSPLETVALGIVQGTVTFLALLAGTIVFRRGGLHHVGLDVGRAPRAAVTAALAMLLAMPVIFAVMAGTESLWNALRWPHAQEHELLKILREARTPWLRDLTILAASVVAPLSEEMLFRGYVQTALGVWFTRLATRGFPSYAAPAVAHDPVGVPLDYARPDVSAATFEADDGRSFPTGRLAWARWAAVVVTSLLFASLHPWWSSPPIFVLALCLGYAYERTGNLWVNVLMHSIFNTLMIALFLSQS